MQRYGARASYGQDGDEIPPVMIEPRRRTGTGIT